MWNQAELRRVIQISVVATVAIALIYIYFVGVTFLSFKALQGFSVGLSTITLFWVFYFRWGWCWPILDKLFDKPDLNGTWTGTLKTDWRDPQGQEVEPKDFAIVVRQTFFQLHFTTFTDSFIALSYVEGFWIDRERGIKRIVFLYAQDSTTVGEEGNREGATELRVLGEPAQRMTGRYWSNTKTNGFIELEKISREQAESFEEAMRMKKESIKNVA
jgi:hypothetical protein